MKANALLLAAGAALALFWIFPKSRQSNSKQKTAADVLAELNDSTKRAFSGSIDKLTEAENQNAVVQTALIRNWQLSGDMPPPPVRAMLAPYVPIKNLRAWDGGMPWWPLSRNDQYDYLQAIPYLLAWAAGKTYKEVGLE